MIPVYLIGGGWLAETFPDTYGRFVRAASRNRPARIAIIVAEETGAEPHAQFLRFRGAFQAAGLDPAAAVEIIVPEGDHLTGEMLAGCDPTGAFVCGGLTPAYHHALCRDKRWLAYLFENRIPYGGFSAGASVAAETAIVGGWRRRINGREVQVADENAGEDLDLLDVRNGLGLVDCAIDVHATQWGTLSRLIHAVDAGASNAGWAIDENTMLEIIETNVSVHGAGSAYRVRRGEDRSTIDIFQRGAHIFPVE